LYCSNLYHIAILQSGKGNQYGNGPFEGTEKGHLSRILNILRNKAFTISKVFG